MRSNISELAANPGMQYTEILLVSIIEKTLLQGKNKDINQKNWFQQHKEIELQQKLLFDFSQTLHFLMRQESSDIFEMFYHSFVSKFKHFSCQTV